MFRERTRALCTTLQLLWISRLVVGCVLLGVSGSWWFITSLVTGVRCPSALGGHPISPSAYGLWVFEIALFALSISIHLSNSAWPGPIWPGRRPPPALSSSPCPWEGRNFSGMCFCFCFAFCFLGYWLLVLIKCCLPPSELIRMKILKFFFRCFSTLAKNKARRSSKRK